MLRMILISMSVLASGSGFLSLKTTPAAKCKISKSGVIIKEFGASSEKVELEDGEYDIFCKNETLLTHGEGKVTITAGKTKKAHLKVQEQDSKPIANEEVIEEIETKGKGFLLLQPMPITAVARCSVFQRDKIIQKFNLPKAVIELDNGTYKISCATSEGLSGAAIVEVRHGKITRESIQLRSK